MLKFTYSGSFPTIIKHRYLTRNAKREEYRKIFSINNIPEILSYEKAVREEFQRGLAEKLEESDVVFLCDFGHGLIDEEAKQLIQEKAKYLVLNCQTNSTLYSQCECRTFINVLTFMTTPALMITLSFYRLKLKRGKYRWQKTSEWIRTS